jgi:hypothetical protein
MARRGASATPESGSRSEVALGTKKLAEGIRKFTENIIKLEGLIPKRLG